MRLFKTALLTTVLIAFPLAAQAQNASISARRAGTIALRAVPNGQGIKSEKLEREDGVLVYKVDVETPGPGHQEVRVDANTGAVISSRPSGNPAERIIHETGREVSKVGHDVDRDADKVFKHDEARNMNVRISEYRARRIAMRQNPGSMVKDIDLKREHGVMMWEVKTEGPGKYHDKVRIDANTGAVLSEDRGH